MIKRLYLYTTLFFIVFMAIFLCINSFFSNIVNAQCFIEHYKLGEKFFNNCECDSAINYFREANKCSNSDEYRNESVKIAQMIKKCNERAIKEIQLLSDNQLLLIQGGAFYLGCTDDQCTLGLNGCDKTDCPQTSVKVNSFYITQSEVTVAQFELFIKSSNYITDAEKSGYSSLYLDSLSDWIEASGINWKCGIDGNPYLSDLSKIDFPVVFVSWNDANEYCKWLSAETGCKYRLPKEKEWEYAAYDGDKKNIIWFCNSFNDVAWYFTNSSEKFNSSKKRKPSKLDLYDMFGNVWEWCDDWYFTGYGMNSVEIISGQKVLRGGSYLSSFSDCMFYRNSSSQEYSCGQFGFRIVRQINEP